MKKPVPKVPVHHRRRDGVLLALLALIAALVYSNTLHNEFVYDDLGSILENPNIRQLWPLSQSLTGPPGSGSNSRPVAAFSLALNHALGGVDPVGYHIFNVIVHLLTAWVLFGLSRRTLGQALQGSVLSQHATAIALTIAAIWVVHPLGSAALNHVVYRNEALASLFYATTLYAMARLAGSHGAGRVWGGLAVSACLLGVCSKEIVVTAPFVALLYDRAFWAGSFGTAWRLRGSWYLALASSWIPLAVLVANGERGSTVGLGIPDVSPIDYARTQVGVLLHYLRLTFWPQPLLLDYRWPVARDLTSQLPQLLVLIGLLAMTFWSLARAPRWGFLGAMFFLVLAPTSSVIPLVGAICAEHRMYLPLAPLIASVVCGVAWVVLRRHDSRAGRFALGGVAVIACLLLATTTVRRNRDYVTGMAIWTDTLAKQPTNFRAHNTLGSYRMTQGQIDEAIQHYEAALRLEPTYADALVNLAAAEVRRGRMAEAQGHLQEALRRAPGFATAHSNMASLLTRQGRYDEARQHLYQALRLQPHFAMADYNLGHVFLAEGRSDSALVHFARAAERLPHFPEVEHNLAALYLQRGEYAAARRHFLRTLAVEPEHPGALNNLAWLLATAPDPAVRDGEMAVRYVDRLVRLQGQSTAGVLDTRAAALARAGRFDEAVAEAERALQMAESMADTTLMGKLIARLTLYRSGRPYEMPKQEVR